MYAAPFWWHLKENKGTTDQNGVFHLEQAIPETDFWVYAETGTLQDRGAVIPVHIRTAAAGSSFDVGELHVQDGRTLAGRVILSDGKNAPTNAVLVATSEQADGALELKLNESGQFKFEGLPEGVVSVFVFFPGENVPVRYRFSRKNKCTEPRGAKMLTGRLDHDILDLTILLEPPGQDERKLVLPRDDAVLADFNDAKAGPITGVPPQP